MQAYRRFLEPEVISRLSGMELKARLVVEGFITGLHRSPYHGFSVEFAEHRPYMPGDNIKNIDWKVLGRTDKYFIKEFEEETNLKAYILLDSSASMGYKSDGISKLEYAAYLGAALAYLMLLQRDAVGLVIFNEKIQKFIPARSVFSHLHYLLKELEELQPARTTDVSTTLHQMAERIKRRGLIIILSDLWDEPRRVLSGLKHFRHKKHEIIVFHILDPQEKDFAFEKETVFEDLETGEQIFTSPLQIKREYLKQFREWSSNLGWQCRESLIDYQLLDTQINYDKALLSYLNKREKLH